MIHSAPMLCCLTPSGFQYTWYALRGESLSIKKNGYSIGLTKQTSLGYNARTSPTRLPHDTIDTYSAAARSHYYLTVDMVAPGIVLVAIRGAQYLQ